MAEKSCSRSGAQPVEGQEKNGIGRLGGAVDGEAQIEIQDCEKEDGKGAENEEQRFPQIPVATTPDRQDTGDNEKRRHQRPPCPGEHEGYVPPGHALQRDSAAQKTVEPHRRVERVEETHHT